MAVNNRIWVVGAALVMVVILALGFFLGVAPRLEEVAANETQRQAVETQNGIQSAALAKLKKDFENITAFTAELAELQKALPSTNDLSTFIGDLKVLEEKSGVTLTNFVSVEAVPFVLDLGLPVVETPAPVEGQPAEGAEAPAEPVAPAAPVAPVDPNAPPVPVQTLSSDEFVVISVNLTVTGSQAQVLNFVDALQKSPRRYLVTNLKITTEDNKEYIGGVSGYVYVLVDPRDPVKDETPIEEPEVEEPEPTPTPTAGIPTETPAP